MQPKNAGIFEQRFCEITSNAAHITKRRVCGRFSQPFVNKDDSFSSYDRRVLEQSQSLPASASRCKPKPSKIPVAARRDLSANYRTYITTPVLKNVDFYSNWDAMTCYALF